MIAALPATGFRANWRQIALLIVVTAFVGATIGLERTLVPLIAKTDFGLASRSISLSFLITFGVTKAFANLFAGRLSDRIGRRGILVAGWMVGLPVPLLIMYAPSWSWVVFANVLLGLNQGLCWSTTIIMKIDLVRPRQRGLVTGLNEFTGYTGVALAALATGYLAAAHGLRPVPFYPGIVLALAGLVFSALFVEDTHEHARNEAGSEKRTLAEIARLTAGGNRALFAASQAGMVNKINDGMVWGLLPLFFTERGLSVTEVGAIAAIFPGVWGFGQLFTGALSDHWGRKWMIAGGMWLQAAAVLFFLFGEGFWPWWSGAAVLGFGTALVYPTLLATVSDVAHPHWRASALGMYRFWRDSGYAVGAVMAGLLADALDIPVAIGAIGMLTIVSGAVVAGLMFETLERKK